MSDYDFTPENWARECMAVLGCPENYIPPPKPTFWQRTHYAGFNPRYMWLPILVIRENDHEYGTFHTVYIFGFSLLIDGDY